MKPGIYYDIPFEDYLKWDAFSKSGIKSILKSPAHYLFWLMNDDKTKAMDFGSAIDCMVLEPNLVKSKIAIIPSTYISEKEEKKPWNNNSKTCKKTMVELKESGKLILSESEYQKASAIAEKIMSHKTAGEWIRSGKQQVSILWIDSDYGVTCKARFDNLRDEGIDDLKSTFDASPDGFCRQIGKMGYHAGAAMYSDGWAALTANIQLPFNFIAAETDEPFPVATYGLEPDSILTGRMVYKKALKIYKQCKESGKWPAYSEFCEPIEIPLWQINRALDEGIINGYEPTGI